MNNNINFQIIFKHFVLIFFLLVAFSSYAQFDTPDEAPIDEDELNEALNPEEPAAPIDDFLIPLLFFGIVTGWYFIEKSTEFKKQN